MVNYLYFRRALNRLSLIWACFGGGVGTECTKMLPFAPNVHQTFFLHSSDEAVYLQLTNVSLFENKCKDKKFNEKVPNQIRWTCHPQRNKLEDIPQYVIIPRLAPISHCVLMSYKLAVMHSKLRLLEFVNIVPKRKFLHVHRNEDNI
jgi:hypothetical protein